MRGLKSLKWLFPVLALTVLSSVCRATPFDGRPKIILHVQPHNPSNQCVSNLTDCSQAVTSGTLTVPGVGPYYDVYVLEAEGDYRGLNSIYGLGLRYQNGCGSDVQDGHGIDVLSWMPCARTAYYNEWPSPGTANFSFDNCPREDLEVLGHFYLAAYSPDTLRITGLVGNTKVLTCGPELWLYPQDLGSAAFTAAGAGGCNPCVEHCPEPALRSCPPPPPPPPPPTPEAAILLHVDAAHSGNSCGYYLPDASSARVKESLSTSSGPFYFVYVVVAKKQVGNIAGVEFGISYENNNPLGLADGIGVDVFDWVLCADQQFPSLAPAWPSPGSGNLITWIPGTNCQSHATAIAGYFYVGAYSEDRMSITPHPSDGSAKVANCNGTEINLSEANLGFVSFSSSARTQGCNPWTSSCSEPVPVVPSTWSTIKALYTSGR